MSKSHQHEAQNVHSASVCSKVKIAISFYLSQACQRESTSKEQEQNEKLNVIWKRHAIYRHLSQKDVLTFGEVDQREFWQRAEERNQLTAKQYHQLGLAEYQAIEVFVKLF